MKEHIADLESNITEKENALAIKSDETQELQEGYDQLKEEINSLQEVFDFQSIDAIKSSFAEIQKNKKEVNDENKRIMSELNNSTAENRKLTLQINDLTKKMDRYIL